MPRGRPKATLTLSGDDRQTLTRWMRRSKITKALALRAGIVLRSADGLSNGEVASELKINPK